MNYETIDRIRSMEELYDRAIVLVKKADRTVSETEELESAAARLREYYESPQWKEDFEADEAGKLPKGLKRGVLSEDGIYNLLDEINEEGFTSGKRIRTDDSVKKTIITVQHTQSVHHTNRHAGAWGDWELTDLGHQQAAAVGRYLQKEGCSEGYTMYVSDLKRAYQTAEEINRTLGLQPIVTDVIREVNAGAGNGKPWEWYDEHKIQPGEFYDVDYRPFPDAESDRDLWNRLYPFYQEILNNDKNRILIVSHGTALSFLQAMLTGRTLQEQQYYRFKGPSGSVSRFDVLNDGRVITKYINRICEET